MRNTLVTRISVLMIWLAIGLQSLSVAAQGKGAPAKSEAMSPIQHEKSQDMEDIHRMFAYTDRIKRTVKKTSRGVETVTESTDPKVAAMLQKHTQAMQARFKNHQPIRAWDPLFAALFQHADKIQLEIRNTRNGVKIIETSKDPYTLRILHAHANAVTGFLHDGMMGMAKRHEAPPLGNPVPKKEAAFLGKGDGIKTCPVTGEPIDKNIKAEIGGRTVYFCCASCVSIVKQNPHLYLR